MVMMQRSSLQSLFKRVRAKRAGKSSEEGNPHGHWKGIVIGFFLAEVCMLGATAYIFYQGLDRELPILGFSAPEREAVPAVDREKLQSLLSHFEKKAMTHEALEAQPPAIVDPAQKTWYGSNAEGEGDGGGD